ncbi:MAG: alpha/beta hydrolase [Alcanivoracaceae bacterium]|nr:alpha/beta hydrolase [Alcanivoracaceae bacterium]MCG8393220.1 alpha/beta hydrolase [Pseudomonadales bacterium]|tara:strand:- start:6029 stop:6913 length:885 start_codon:yes stop_codon:yes gene_type:complete
MKQVELVNGDLRFPALMAGEGEPVILLHGFPDTYENWAVQINAIAEAGYTAIAPALRGYAPSCQPGNGDYSLYAAVDDLMVFAAQLGGRVHLIGHDWGAAVGYLACAQSPETFCSFSALAIPPLRRMPQALVKVPEQVLLSGYMQFFQLPMVPEGWLKRGDLSGVETLWRRWSPGWEPEMYLDNAKHTLAEPGVIPAALGWYRGLFRVWRKEHRKARAWLGREIATPTQILIGENDGCMSPRLLEHTLVESDFSAGVELQTLAGAGHFLHLEKPEEVNRHLIRLLKSTECDCSL